MDQRVPPILTAFYSAAFQTPSVSGDWGWWNSDRDPVPALYRHSPERHLPNGERDIASVYMPVIGPYDSSDPDVWEYHILLAKAAGIDGFIVDWLSHPLALTQQERIGNNLQGMLALAERLNFKIALCFEDRQCFPPLQPSVSNREEAVQCLETFFRQAVERFFSSPAYLRVNQKPLITLLNRGVPGDRWDTPFFTLDEWKGIQRQLPEALSLVQNYQPQKPTNNFAIWDSVYPWLSVYLSETDTDEDFWKHSQRSAQQPGYFISGMVTPGYDDRGSGAWGQREPRVFSRRQGAKYSAIWEDNLRHGAQFIQIGTWNNFCDGSCVEPVKEIILHKNAAVPGWGYRELITTREYAARFKQTALWPLTTLFLPERLFRLRKSGAPAGRGDRIRLYLLENDSTGATLGLEQAGV